MPFDEPVAAGQAGVAFGCWHQELQLLQPVVLSVSAPTDGFQAHASALAAADAAAGSVPSTAAAAADALVLLEWVLLLEGLLLLLLHALQVLLLEVLLLLLLLAAVAALEVLLLLLLLMLLPSGCQLLDDHSMQQCWNNVDNPLVDSHSYGYCKSSDHLARLHLARN